MLSRSTVPWGPSSQPAPACDDDMPPNCDDCVSPAMAVALAALVDSMPQSPPPAYKEGANPLDRMNAASTGEKKVIKDPSALPAKPKSKKSAKKKVQEHAEQGSDVSSHGRSDDSHASFESTRSTGETERWRLLVSQSWEALVKMENGTDKKDASEDSAEDQERNDATANIAAQKHDGKKQSKGSLFSWGRGSSGDKAKKEQEGMENNKKKDKDGGMTFAVPQTFEEMCILNANMIGVNVEFVKIVQQCFDRLVGAVKMNDDNRLELETNIMSLRFHKDVKGEFNPGTFKMVMLASLRSLLPKIWTIEHENAWTTMWDMIQGMLSNVMHLPALYEKAVTTFMENHGDELQDFGISAFNRLFAAHPQSESYFKASNARLNFLAGKSLEMSTQIYKDPTRVTNETFGLGLRHIMYNISVEFFEPLVNAIVEELKSRTSDTVAVEGVQYSLTLIATIMVNTCNEGSNPLLRAIAVNSEKGVKKALQAMSKAERNGKYL